VAVLAAGLVLPSLASEQVRPQQQQQQQQQHHAAC
jgi:hypothetical protein